MEPITQDTHAPTPALDDPVAARAAFFFDLELTELTATVAQADPEEPRGVY